MKREHPRERLTAGAGPWRGHPKLIPSVPEEVTGGAHREWPPEAGSPSLSTAVRAGAVPAPSPAPLTVSQCSLDGLNARHDLGQVCEGRGGTGHVLQHTEGLKVCQQTDTENPNVEKLYRTDKALDAQILHSCPLKSHYSSVRILITALLRQVWCQRWDSQQWDRLLRALFPPTQQEALLKN